jgi:hypothetical protein
MGSISRFIGSAPNLNSVFNHPEQNRRTLPSLSLAVPTSNKPEVQTGSRLERSATVDGVINRRELLSPRIEYREESSNEEVANDQYLNSVSNLPFSLAADKSKF